MNEAKAKAQAEYCRKNRLPFFAPTDGVCWRCRKNIYEKITLEEASSELVIGCPHCHKSYCD